MQIKKLACDLGKWRKGRCDEASAEVGSEQKEGREVSHARWRKEQGQGLEACKAPWDLWEHGGESQEYTLSERER